MASTIDSHSSLILASSSEKVSEDVLLAEFGIDIPKGLERALLMARRIVDGEAPDVPMEAARIVSTLSRQALDIQCLTTLHDRLHPRFEIDQHSR
jgi:hypothetical protein